MTTAIQTPVHGIVGASHRRVDALEKVTGRAPYITDLRTPGAAHARIWRSPIAHGHIRRIETAAARACTGVLAVVTAADLTFCELFYGPAYKDQPILAVDRVRYAGEPVAAVVAETEAQAEAALGFIQVELDELPAVTSLEEALAPGAPVLHEKLRMAGAFRDLASLKPTPGTNICHHFHYERGDAAAGFAEADEVFEDTFHFPKIGRASCRERV